VKITCSGQASSFKGGLQYRKCFRRGRYVETVGTPTPGGDPFVAAPGQSGSSCLWAAQPVASSRAARVFRVSTRTWVRPRKVFGARLTLWVCLTKFPCSRGLYVLGTPARGRVADAVHPVPERRERVPTLVTGSVAIPRLATGPNKVGGVVKGGASKARACAVCLMATLGCVGRIVGAAWRRGGCSYSPKLVRTGA